MKVLITYICFICLSIFAKAQTDSLAPYLYMSLEELLKEKVTTVGKQQQKISDILVCVADVNFKR
jgi:hypothetical protein